MALTPAPNPVNACSTFTVAITGPATATSVSLVYDGGAPIVVPLIAGVGTSPAITAVGSGTQLIVGTFNDIAGTVETGTITVIPAPAGTMTTTLTTSGGLTTANTILVCGSSLATTGGTVTYTVSGGGLPITTPVVGGVVTPVSLGALTAGQTVTAVFTPTAGTCSPCSFAPVTVTVTGTPCVITIIPPVGTITAGTATPVQVFVTCNGVPVSGAVVTFGGTASGTATTNASGFATANLTFPAAGTATITATVTAAGTTCSCTAVAATPVTVTVSGVTPPSGTLTALPSCWRLNLPLPFPNLFTAVLRATVTPAQSGVAVNFYVGGHFVGTAITDATGTATLNADLSVFQIVSPVFTATTVLGGTAVSSTAPLLPCIPPL